MPPPSPRRHEGSERRLHRFLRKHDRDERAFDPEKAPDWRGSSTDLVVNPGGFRADLEGLVEHYHSKLRAELTPEELTDELVRAFKEEDTNNALGIADELLEGFGVEALGPVNHRDGPPYLYINFGDTYDPTIMWSRGDNKVFVAMGGWGEVWTDEGEPNLIDEGWERWLGRQFETAVLTDLENHDPHEGEPGAAEAEAMLEDGHGRELFDQALRMAQDASGQVSQYPEIAQESDGIFVHHLDVVVRQAARMIQQGWQPKLTSNSRLAPR
jgi:hypothetical protein